MLARLRIQLHPSAVQIASIRQQPLYEASVKAHLTIRHIAFAAHIHPDMLQLIQMLNIIVPINRVFNDMIDGIISKNKFPFK
ncbi:hypothetical protein D3C78_1561440 [compost metagenome]